MKVRLRWEEPPERESRARNSKYTAVVATLRANPGRWAVIFEGQRNSAASMTWQLRHGRASAFCPVGEFEFDHRARGEDSKIYARFVGETPP